MNSFIFAHNGFLSTGGKYYAEPVIWTLPLSSISIGSDDAWMLSLPRIHHGYSGGSMDPGFEYTSGYGPVKCHVVAEILDAAYQPIVNYEMILEPNMADGTANTLVLKANSQEIGRTATIGGAKYGVYWWAYQLDVGNTNASLSFLTRPDGSIEVGAVYPNQSLMGTVTVSPLAGSDFTQPSYLRVTSSTGITGGEGRGTFGIFHALYGGGVWLGTVDLSHP
jgi:hypothetical protein